MIRKSCVRALLAALLLGLTPLGASAQEAEKKSSPEALRRFQDAANFQNNGAFDLAVEEWEKFIQQHAADPLILKARHYAGVSHMQATARNYEKAATRFAEVVAGDAKFELREDALLNLGWCQYSLAGQGMAAKYDDAAKTFAQLVKEFPKGKYVDQALFFQGEALYRLDRKPEAIAAYEALAKDQPESKLRADALYAAGVTHEELGQFAAAAPVYETFLKDFAEHELATEVRMRKGETLLQGGELAEAEKVFAATVAVENFPLKDHALSRQALTVAKQDRFADAAKLYARLATDFDKSVYAPEAVLEAGRCFYRAGEFADAATWFQKVLAAGGEHAAEAAHWICRIHLRNGEGAKAAELAAATLPKAGDSPYLAALKMDRAEGLLEQGGDQRATALAEFLKIAAEHPDSEQAPQALYNASFTALELKDYAATKTHADAFLAKHAEHRLAPDVRYLAAESQLHLKAYDAAEAGFRALVAAAGDHPEINIWRLRLALVLYLQKKYDDTVKLLGPLVEQLAAGEQRAEGQFLLGVSHFYLNQFEPAAAALAASLAAAPQWRQADEALLFLGQSQRRLGKGAEAQASYEKLLKDYAQSRVLDQAHFRLGELFYAAEDYARATAQYDAVLAAAGESLFVPFALYGKGWAQLKAKEYEPAAKAFAALLEKHPQHQLAADARFARALCLRQAGDAKGALDDLTAYLAGEGKLNHRLEALYERGLAEVSLEQYDAAIASFGAIVAEQEEKYAQLDRVLYELAWAHKSKGDAPASLTHFTRLAAEHPDSDLAAEAHFHLGEDRYDAKDYPAAAAAYTQAKTKAQQEVLAEKAAYKLGWAHYQQQKYPEAAAEFTGQLAQHPSGALRVEGEFMKSEALFKAGKFAEALPGYQAVLAAWKDKADADMAALVLAHLHGGQSAAQVKKWDDSLALLRPIVEKHADSAYAAEALYELAFAHQNKGELDEALKHYEQAADKSRTAVGARARFMMGELLFLQKKFDDAVKEFQRVMFGYGGDMAADDVKPWQAKAGSEAGRCTEVRIADARGPERARLIGEAQRFYTYVVEKHPSSDMAANAKKRLDELKKLQ